MYSAGGRAAFTPHPRYHVDGERLCMQRRHEEGGATRLHRHHPRAGRGLAIPGRGSLSLCTPGSKSGRTPLVARGIIP